jgi:hypothetical protein
MQLGLYLPQHTLCELPLQGPASAAALSQSYLCYFHGVHCVDHTALHYTASSDSQASI